ncbi:hypothetical protein ACH427_03145 [Streptomyces sp. NPDC020379]|uniref:hypothetical protein n=1 Tax=Streptomyces sp. NPDC020379 TaxID=3365071 RepID=UPI00378FC0BE
MPVDVLNLVLGAGGAASLAGFLKLWFERHDAFDRARREHMEDLAQWRRELQDTVHELQEWAEFYRQMSADYAWQLRQSGIEPHTTAVEPDNSD